MEDDKNTNPELAAAQAADDAEWATVNNDFLESQGIKPEDDKPADKPAPTGDDDHIVTGNGSADYKPPVDDAAKKAADDKAAADKKAADDAAEAKKAEFETPELTEARHKKEAADKAEADKAAASNARAVDQASAAATARATSRELAADEAAMKNDIREQMFKDVPNPLIDADGDPMDSIEEVMKHINPNTQKLFTEEQAGAWLLAATQYYNKELAKNEKTIEQISDVNLTLKDWGFSIAKKYGSYLKAHPDEQKEIYDDYMATVETDPKTDIITKAPVNMERFYDRALSGKVQAQQVTETAAQKEAKHKVELEKARQRQDRGDVYKGGNTETMSDDEKEWDAAHRNYFGEDLLKGKK